MWSKTARHPIWVFDSGKWWRYTMHEIKKLLPEYDYLFYGDNAHMPYGDREPADVKLLSFAWIQWLFSQWCQIVIVACNTAAAYAVRDRQTQFPHQKVLSVTIPGIEALVESDGYSSLVLSTSGTEKSGIIPELALRADYKWALRVKQLPWLADIIEEEDEEHHLSRTERKKILSRFIGSAGQDVDTLLLACTHYGVWYQDFQELYPDKVIIDPSQEAAMRLVDYLKRHPDIESKLTKWGVVEEYWTKEAEWFAPK